MADSIPYGRPIVYYSSHAALPLLSFLIFLTSALDLLAQFLLWFLPLAGEGLRRVRLQLKRSKYLTKIWLNSAPPPPPPSEPFKWSDVTGAVKGWWRAFIEWLKRGVRCVEGWLDSLGGGNKVQHRKKTAVGGGGSISSVRERMERIALQRQGRPRSWLFCRLWS